MPRFRLWMIVGALVVSAWVPDGGIAAAAQAEEQEYALVKGTVFTPEGQLLRGASVRIERIDVEEDQRKKCGRAAVIGWESSLFACRQDPQNTSSRSKPGTSRPTPGRSRSQAMNGLTYRSFSKGSIVFLLLASLAFPAEAQFGRRRDEGRRSKNLRGVVVDLGERPIPGARVFVRDTKSNIIRTLTTNESGLYSVTGLSPEADYEVHAEFRGVASTKKYLSAFLNRRDNVLNLHVDIELETDAGTAGSGIELETYDRVRLQASFDMPSGVPAPVPAVILLHGFGEDRAVWGTFTGELLRRGWAVMRIDLRGHGGSRVRNDSPIEASTAWRTSPHEFPLDVNPALDWLKAQPRIDTSRIVAIGTGVGANLALIACGRFPEVHTAVAINPSLPEALAMAGSAQDFRPRSALIVVEDEAEGQRIEEYVGQPSRVETAQVSGGTGRWIREKQVTDSIFRWLTETF